MAGTSVDELVDAYQRTLAAGVERLGNGTEGRILVGAIVENARAARSRLVLQVQGGDKQVARLDAFLAEAEKNDVVGQLFAWLRSTVTDAGKQVVQWVLYAAVTLAWPPAVLSGIGVLLAWSGILQDLGRGIGGALLAALACLLLFAQRSPGAASRIAVTAGRAIGPAAASGADWASRGFAAALSTVGSVGLDAERVLAGSLAPTATSFFALAAPPGFDVPARSRRVAQGVMWVTAVIVAVCVVVVLWGVLDGFSDAWNSNPATCPKAPDGSCVNP